jgi:restriction system protein
MARRQGWGETSNVCREIAVAIPDYESCMIPLLKLLADGNLRTMKELSQQIADHFGLTDEERQRLLPSGQQSYINNRVGWAKSYLKKAGLLENPSRGKVRITEEGRSVLRDAPPAINCEYLMRYPSFVEFWKQKRRTESDEGEPETTATSESDRTPDEAIQTAYDEIRDALADDLLVQVMSCNPTFFERLVLDVLIAMGYGGALPDAGTHLGRAHDGGIDGIINEDKLGLDIICVQAKRWKDCVGRPIVQAFAGSMEAHRAKKGVLITTSTFSRDARDFVDRIERKIVLIDGQQLAQLMIDYDVGVASAKTYTIKKIDSDYFNDTE